MRGHLPSMEPVFERQRSAGASGWQRLPGTGTAWVRQGWADAFAQSGLHALDDFFQISGDALGKAGLGDRYRARLFLRRQGRLEVVYLKRWHHESLKDRLRCWYEDGTWQSLAAREVSVAEALAAEGLPVVETLAWGWREVGGEGRSSFLVLAAVPGEPAHHWLRRVDLPRSVRWHMQCELAILLGELLRRFHARGWRHRDLYLCHLFVAEMVLGWRLSLIDLQRVFRPRWRGERWRIKDLAQLNYSAAAEWVSRSMRMRFARSYFGVKRLTPDQKRVLRKVEWKTSRISRHTRAAARFG